jgi:hypothetical protein
MSVEDTVIEEAIAVLVAQRDLLRAAVQVMGSHTCEPWVGDANPIRLVMLNVATQAMDAIDPPRRHDEHSGGGFGE